jgi:hypothetical protein
VLLQASDRNLDGILGFPPPIPDNSEIVFSNRPEPIPSPSLTNQHHFYSMHPVVCGTVA